MALTKKEAAEMDALREQLAQERAMRWPEYGEPAPVQLAGIAGDALTVGWFVHTWATEYSVSQGCSNGYNHSDRDTTRAITQGAGCFYDTRREALQQARIELTRRFAKALAGLDAEIAAEQGGGAS